MSPSGHASQTRRGPMLQALFSLRARHRISTVGIARRRLVRGRSPTASTAGCRATHQARSWLRTDLESPPVTQVLHVCTHAAVSIPRSERGSSTRRRRWRWRRWRRRRASQQHRASRLTAATRSAALARSVPAYPLEEVLDRLPNFIVHVRIGAERLCRLRCCQGLSRATTLCLKLAASCLPRHAAQPRTTNAGILQKAKRKSMVGSGQHRQQQAREHRCTRCCRARPCASAL